MKKQFIMILAAAGMLPSCTSSSEPFVEQGDGEQIISLKVSSAGDGLTTRAGRELYSEEAAQAIDNVKLVIVDSDNKVVTQTTVGRWLEIAKEYTTDGHGLETVAKIPSGDKVKEPGEYKIYAYGYSQGTEYDNLSSAIGQVTVGDDFNENQLLPFTSASGRLAEEIFAGEGSLSVAENNTATGSVTLHRQVAGTFGYFKNIPYVEGSSKLVLRTFAKANTQLIAGNFVNGENAAVNVVNGTGESSSEIIYTINLSDWFEEIANNSESNTIATATWKNPYAQAGAAFETGSVFGGTFLIPFAAVSDRNTFVLELRNDEDKVLRDWNIKLPADDSQIGTISRWTWVDGNFVKSDITEEALSYSVLRNHLYSVGTRSSKTPSNPGNGTTDAPQDLNKDQILTLQVNDNWETIHHMVVE